MTTKRFQLVELVVILVVIMVGLSLVPALLGQLMTQAKTKQCAVNMAEIIKAATSYSNDNSGYLPPAYNSKQKVGTNWPMRLRSYLKLSTRKSGWKPKDYAIFTCPADETKTAKWLPRNGHLSKISYCCNLAVMDITNADGNADKVKGSRKLKDIKEPAKVIVFAENHNSSNGLRYSDQSFKCYNKYYSFEYTVKNGTLENDKGKRGYHDYKNNWAFADGSVKTMRWEDTVKPENLWKP